MHIVPESVHGTAARGYCKDVLPGVEASAEEGQLLFSLDIAVWTVFGKVADLSTSGRRHHCKRKRAK
jgi:hypothetical protein